MQDSIAHLNVREMYEVSLHKTIEYRDIELI